MADPKLMREQRDLINDLKQKVTVLERELQMIHNNSERELEQLRKENEELQAKKNDDEFNKDMQSHMEKMTVQRLKQELIASKTEIDQASRQVELLNQELKSQQDFYEKEVNKLKNERSVSGPTEADSITIGSLQSKVKNIESRLREALSDKDECLKQISMLKQEL